MGSYNARLQKEFTLFGYSRRRCGATAALIRQPQTHPHNEDPEIRNKILWEGVTIFRCRRKPECPDIKPTKVGMESANQIHIRNHWQAALEKGKCTSTKPTNFFFNRLATGVVCHPDTEQNRPYCKNPLVLFYFWV